jgi:hypothetical protein
MDFDVLVVSSPFEAKLKLYHGNSCEPLLTMEFIAVLRTAQNLL